MDTELLLNELITNLHDNDSLDLTPNQLEIIRTVSGELLLNFNITRQSTEVALYNDSLQQCVKMYLASRIIEGLSKRTLDLYKLRLTQFITSAEIVGKDINEITTNMIRVFLYNYQELHEVSNRTLDNYRTIITTFFGWASAEGYCDKNPCVTIKKIKYTRKQKEALTEMELEQFRNTCTSKRDKALVEFMFSTGARCTEICNCKISDVDFEHKEVTILGKGDKYRTDYLNSKCILLLKDYLDSRNDKSPYLFVTQKGQRQLTKSGLENIITELWKQSGIVKKITPHTLRHTTATIALQRGMAVEQVQKMLGHVNINTTMVYAEVNKNDVKRVHANVII